MNLFTQLQRYIIDYAVPLIIDKNDLTESVVQSITVEFPRDTSHGELATNVAMVLARPLKGKKNPREIAETLVKQIQQFHYIETAEVAGAGFINMRFKPAFWLQEVKVILRDGEQYGTSTIGLGKKVNVEYVSVNPTGPMHIGHARGAVIGDTLANLLTKASFDVTKEYYINDAGAQIDMLARSVYARYRQLYGEKVPMEQGMYPGEYLIPVAEELKATYGGTLLGEEDEWLEEVKSFAVESMMTLIKDDLAQLGVVHDVFTSEQQIRDEGWLDKALEHLQSKDLLYRGVLNPPRGKTVEEWEPTEQLLFRSTRFHDDSDRPIQKSNGDYTYFAGDMGYALHKLDRGFARLVMVLGADHSGYIARMKALVSALSDDRAQLDVQIAQMVKFMDGGEQVKMSKRSGSFITVRDVTDEIGKDILRFIMLMRKPEQQLDFDLQKVKEQSKDNPVFYVQYAHARCKSLMRHAAQHHYDEVKLSQIADHIDVSLLSSPADIQLIKILTHFPKQVEAAALAYEPHRIAYYLYDVATELHAFWNKGGEDPNLRFIVEHQPELTKARLALARAVGIVLAAGLQILGVTPAEEMR
ncbi:MAG: arginine--tRNA ligase [Alphaproteobacteria bacterium]|nr:MAG: arginine--tRNA ligase [Alphaproteobacteria bacterium]